MYSRKYLKYKKKYMLEKLKLIGGVWSKCLFVNAHGSEVFGKNIKLKENQMVIMYYKPHCSMYYYDFETRNLIDSVIQTKCEESNYITLHRVFDKMKIEFSETYAVYSGNRNDVNFFNKFFDDGLIKDNNISIIPNLSFNFENYHKDPISFSAYSFPVSEDPDIVEKFRKYHEYGKKPKVEFPLKNDEIFFRDYQEDEHGLINSSIELIDYIDLFNFVWISSCRSLKTSYHKSEKHIGIPLLIFILYSGYFIVMDLLEIDEEDKDNFINRYYNENRKVFENLEYSHDRKKFLDYYLDLMYDMFFGLVKYKGISRFYEIYSKYKFRYTFDNLDYYFTKNNKNKDLLILVFNNIIKISNYLYFDIEFGRVQFPSYSKFDNVKILTFTYTLSYFIHKSIDYPNIIMPITEKLKLDIKDLLKKYKILDISWYRGIDSLDMLKNIKFNEINKKKAINLYDELSDVRERLNKIFVSIDSIIKHYDEIINLKKKFRYYKYIIDPVEEYIDKFKNIKIDYINFFINNYELSIIFASIKIGIYNINKLYNEIKYTSPNYNEIIIHDRESKNESSIDTIDIGNIKDKIITKIEKLGNREIFTNPSFTKGEMYQKILFNVNIEMLIYDLINIQKFLFDIFAQLGVDIVKNVFI